MRGLKGKVAVVTGAAGGIGTAICARLIEEGSRVVACDIDETALTRLRERLTSDSLTTLVFDIADFAAVERAVDDTIEGVGRIDILINNAGWDIAKPFVETTPDFW